MNEINEINSSLRHYFDDLVNPSWRKVTCSYVQLHAVTCSDVQLHAKTCKRMLTCNDLQKNVDLQWLAKTCKDCWLAITCKDCWRAITCKDCWHAITCNVMQKIWRVMTCNVMQKYMTCNDMQKKYNDVQSSRSWIFLNLVFVVLPAFQLFCRIWVP